MASIFSADLRNNVRVVVPATSGTLYRESDSPVTAKRTVEETSKWRQGLRLMTFELRGYMCHLLLGIAAGSSVGAKEGNAEAVWYSAVEGCLLFTSLFCSQYKARPLGA